MESRFKSSLSDAESERDWQAIALRYAGPDGQLIVASGQWAAAPQHFQRVFTQGRYSCKSDHLGR